MNLLRLLPSLLLLGAPLLLTAKEPSYTLPAPPLELATNEEKFRRFAKEVAADVERLLGLPAAIDDPATFKLPLSTRVHLAHHFGDNEKAISTAAWIRSLQPPSADRAFAGLTTLASVTARQQNPEAAPSAAAYRATFAREFSRVLGDLPRTLEIVTMLRSQRDKIAGVTEAALLAETSDKIVPAIARRGYCGLEEADQLVRVRHRMASILPVRAETLQALDASIAARISP